MYSIDDLAASWPVFACSIGLPPSPESHPVTPSDNKAPVVTVQMTDLRGAVGSRRMFSLLIRSRIFEVRAANQAQFQRNSNRGARSHREWDRTIIHRDAKTQFAVAATDLPCPGRFAPVTGARTRPEP